jgi:hypothetical protein
MTGHQIQRFIDALLDAFPTEEQLERLLRVRLDKNLYRISTAVRLQARIDRRRDQPGHHLPAGRGLARRREPSERGRRRARAEA